MNEKQYKIYVYTNKINGKKYVGQTHSTLKKRANSNGSGYKNCTRFWNAIQKYGWDNFEAEILYDNLTQEMANELEEKLIQTLQTTNDEYGYNIALGGDNHSNQAKKISVVKFDFNYIKRYDSITDASIENNIDQSHIKRACIHEYNQSGGFIWLLEEDYISGNYDKENILYLLHKEFEHPNSRPVIQCDLEMNFISRYKNMCEASRKTGIRRNGINDNCAHRLKTSGGYIWMYEDEYEKNKENANEISLAAKTTKHKKNAVIQLDLNMNYISEFSSILEASKTTKTDRKLIVDVCKEKYKQAKGYIWRYSLDYYGLQEQQIS